MQRKSFTLIELMIVVAIIAIIAAIAIPGLLRARISSNETSAIGSVRSTSTSQNQFQNAGLKDRDLDGVGEYGYYTELAGVATIPVGATVGEVAKPTFVNSVFGTTCVVSGTLGIANKSGYNFKMWLPDGAGVPVSEDGTTPVAPFSTFPPTGADAAEANAQETRWCTYSWPTSAGNSGNKAFFVNQAGEVIATSNISGPGTYFFTATVGPIANEIFDVSVTSDIDGDLLIGVSTTASTAVWNPTS